MITSDARGLLCPFIDGGLQTFRCAAGGCMAWTIEDPTDSSGHCALITSHRASHSFSEHAHDLFDRLRPHMDQIFPGLVNRDTPPVYTGVADPEPSDPEQAPSDPEQAPGDVAGSGV